MIYPYTKPPSSFPWETIYDGLHKHVTSLIEEQLTIIHKLLLECNEIDRISYIQINNTTKNSFDSLWNEHKIVDIAGNVYFHMIVEWSIVYEKK